MAVHHRRVQQGHQRWATSYAAHFPNQHIPVPGCIDRSLCIIDEFGKGTGPADGLALLAATLRRFAALPCPPRVVLCTHFR